MKVPETGEVMAVMQTAMLAGLPSTRLRDAVLAHPTFAEGHGPLLSQVPPRAAQQAAACLFPRHRPAAIQ